ncbi:hypothetical protein HPB52_022561 [Rhipicephalus sanguineus]|uniref:CCHC-type domain-containing protein n=1 Tax=Rhipicephalus sanguineus TaxID=34632 RepID=A0A9D4PG35_RHISA|nr:hypothetical protein HPB52_022561 [Rhipicephalus sanguineus]
MPEQRSEQPPIGESDKKQREQRLRQITRASRMPQLLREDYKIIVRPRGGLRQAADVPREAREKDTICPNYQQNIIVVSTPVEEHANRYQRIACIKLGTQEFEASAYGAAPENTSKGVIRGIPIDDSARDITANVITPINPTALVAKRMGNTTNVIVLFDGYRVPSYAKYGGALIHCSLYRKQLDVCYHCGRLRHRADVCPNPNDKICRGCRMPNPLENHECKATCQLCDQDHPTADRTCKARYKTPFLVRKRRWERSRQEQENTSYAEQERPSNANSASDQSESFPRLAHERRSRSRSRNKCRSKSRSQSRSREPQSPGADASFRVSWADKVKGASAEASSDQKVTKLEEELAQLKQMILQNNQTIVAMREENKKLREEIHKYKNGKLQCSDATVITEDIVTSIEENFDSPLPKRKAVENNGEGTSKPKKTKTANMLHERQAEFQQRLSPLSKRRQRTAGSGNQNAI